MRLPTGMSVIVKIYRLLKNTIVKFGRDGGSYMAAGIAYYALLSVFPLVFGMLAVFGFYSSPGELGYRIADFLNEAFFIPPDIIERNLSNITRYRTVLGIVSVIGLLWAGTGVFSAVNRGINRAWNVGRDRNYIIRKLRDLAMVAITGLLILVYIESNSVFPFLRYLGIVETGTLANVWGKLISIVMITAIFVALYKFIPNRKVPWRYTWPGVIFGVVFFESVRVLFTWYLANYANYEMVYGSLASIIVTLVWIYYSSIVLLLGAELNSEYFRMSGAA